MKILKGCKRACVWDRDRKLNVKKEVLVLDGKAYFFFDEYYALMEASEPDGIYSFKHLIELKEWKRLEDLAALEDEKIFSFEGEKPLATCTIPLPYLGRALLFSQKASTSYFLNTIAFDWNDKALVTTDGKSLYRYKGGDWHNDGIEDVLLLPDIKPLEKATEVFFYKDFWSFPVGEFTFFGEYVREKFPRYQAVIPENFGKEVFTIPSKATLSFEKKRQKLGKVALPYIQAGEDFGFVIELLERLCTCKVPFIYTQGQKVAGYKTEEELFLVMPIRTGE